MQILVLLGMYFDAVVVFVTSQTLLFRLALAILCVLLVKVHILGNSRLHTQYGHSQSEKNLGVGDKYHRSIKVHT